MFEVFIFFLMIRRPPRTTRTDTLFPYTTLWQPEGAVEHVERGVGGERREFGLEPLRRRAATHPILEQLMDAGAAPARVGGGAQRVERRQAEHLVGIIGKGIAREPVDRGQDRKSTRLNSSH